MDKPHYKGVEVDIGGVIYEIPPLSLGSIERLQPKLQSFDTLTDFAAKQVIILEVVHAALKRNYPALTVDDLKELLDAENLWPVFWATMQASGFVPKGEGTPDPKAVASGLTGSLSTPNSPPPSAGLSTTSESASASPS
jgi:hypothetical protein